MSDAPHFDQSMLEGKGKEELATIATSLGQKPPARAKKADVIALIMQLVGAPRDADAAGGTDVEADSPATPVAQPARAPGAATPGTGTVVETDSAGGGLIGRAASEPPSSSSATNLGGDSARAPGRPPSLIGDDRPPRSGPYANRGGQGPSGGSRETEAPADPRNNAGDRDRSGSDRSVSGNSNPRQAGRSENGDTDEKAGANSHDRDSGRGRRDAANLDAGEATESAEQSDRAPYQSDSNLNPTGVDGEMGDDGELANRRRRRRGRDRERRPDGEGSEQGQSQPEPLAVEGLVELRDEGYGFLRLKGYLPSRDDAYISVKQTRQFGLRTGDVVAGKARPANRNEKNPALLQVERVNGHPSHQQPPRRRFDDLTPLFPDERLRLELTDDPANATVRIVDLVAPIGKGQRGLIVSPPKAGKTTVVKHLVRSIEVNHPEVELLVLLVDERPEEVTDMRRWLVRGTVAASTFDRPAEEHITVSELVIERAKRLVEDGKDVVVILDGITRLARAYNLAAPASGRVMAGGIDTGALYPPKKFFGAARNAEEGGSLTIIATALVETNTRMDEVIFEEFKGTGNMELKLDRKLAERRIFPAIDVDASSTRHEELLFSRQQLPQVWKLRRVLGALRDESGSSAAGIEMLTDRLKAFKTNDAFLDEVAKTTGA